MQKLGKLFLESALSAGDRVLLTTRCAQSEPTVLEREPAVLGDLIVVAVDVCHPAFVLVRQGSTDEVGDGEPVRL